MLLEYILEKFIILLAVFLGEEIFISDKKKVCVTVINNEGQFLGHIGYKNQNRPSQGIGFVNDTILISFSDFKEVQIYEFSKNGSCSFKYELRNIKVKLYF